MSAASEAEYTLYYHPFIARSGWIAIQFAYAGIPLNWNENLESIACANGAKQTGLFAVPILKHGDWTLSQTNTIVRYVADQFGL